MNVRFSLVDWAIATLAIAFSGQLAFLHAQNFHRHLNVQTDSYGEFELIYGNPLVVRGSLTVDEAALPKLIPRDPGGTEIGFIPAKLEISEIVYASPEIFGDARFSRLLAPDHRDEMRTLTIDSPVIAFRSREDKEWRVTLGNFENLGVFVVSHCPLLGKYYLDPIRQVPDELRVLELLATRIELLKQWNADWLERLRR